MMARPEGGQPRVIPPPLPTPLPGTSRRDAVARAALPTDHRTLPPLGDAFDAPLDAGLVALGLELPAAARAAIEAQARLLVAWSGAINLTAHRTPEAIAVEHVLDSLTAVGLLEGRRDLIDLGSGAGYPGLPLAACLPLRRVALVESVAKKARFLRAAAGAATDELRGGGRPVPVMEAIAVRAEDLARDTGHRQSWDVATARALAATRELVELALPLLRVGGRLIAWKRDDGADSLERELAAAADAIRICGGAGPVVHRVSLAGLDDHRLVVIAKRQHTPSHLPRPPAERRRALLR